jgi:hypothetical protein
MQRVYQQVAEQVTDTLWSRRLDLERFLPALHQEMLSRVRQVNATAGDYEFEELNYAADQERESRLFLEGLGDAVAELEVADRYSAPTDDRITLGHVKAASAPLRNLN